MDNIVLSHLYVWEYFYLNQCSHLRSCRASVNIEKLSFLYNPASLGLVYMLLLLLLLLLL